MQRQSPAGCRGNMRCGQKMAMLQCRSPREFPSGGPPHHSRAATFPSSTFLPKVVVKFVPFPRRVQRHRSFRITLHSTENIPYKMTKFAVIVKRNSDTFSARIHLLSLLDVLFFFYILHFVVSEMENFAVF